jgi:uncharacterized membrane protein YukC
MKRPWTIYDTLAIGLLVLIGVLLALIAYGVLCSADLHHTAMRV